MNTTRISLIARLKDLGDAEAWAEFDRLYRPILYRFAHACGVSGSVADDVVQDCVASVLSHLQSFHHEPGRGRFRAWLRAMIANRISNLRRKRHEVQAQSRDLAEAIADDPTPDHIFEQIWMEEHLRYCIAAVGQEIESGTFAAFRMYVLEERPVEAVCRELNMTANQVYNIKWRVTQRISQKLRELDF